MTTGAPELADSIIVDSVELAKFLQLDDPGFFDYEYRRFLPDRAVFVQARLDGQLLGTQGLMPCPLMVGGRRVMTGRAELAMVAPRWRTGRLFGQLVNLAASRGAEKGHELIWGTTGQKVPFQRNGFLYFDDFYQHALLCIAPGRIREDLRRPQDDRMRAAKLASAAPSLGLRAVSMMGACAELEIVSRSRADADVDQLYQHLRGKLPLVVLPHDPAFLDWLLEGGGRTIERFYAYDGRTLAAYAYVDQSEGTTAMMVDFAARDAPSMRALIRAIVSRLAPRGIAFLHTGYNVRNPLLARQQRWLVASGFVPFYRGGGFVIRPLRFADFNYLGDLSRWYITGLWFVLHPHH